MPECAYKPCHVFFEQNKTGRKRIYCCDPHKLLAQRPHIKEHTRNCKYCDKLFVTRRSRKVYCCYKCQRKSNNIARIVSQTPEQTAAKQRRRDAKLEARVRATLNCALHTACLRAFKLPCLNCTKKIYKEDAWQHEPGVLVQNR